jgi:hypothetical protein
MVWYGRASLILVFVVVGWCALAKAMLVPVPASMVTTPLGVVILLGGDIIIGSLGENFACSRQVAVATKLCPCWHHFGGLLWWC